MSKRKPTPLSGTPTLSQLRSLLAVVDAGGFSGAAAELGVSQSSLSEAVGKLEETVGRPLLKRGPTGTVPTASGERILDYARTAVQAASDVMQAVQDVNELSGILRVATFRSVATHLLPPVLAQFRINYPKVRIELIDGENSLNTKSFLQTGQADLALFVISEPIADLKVIPVIQDEYLFIAPASRGNTLVQWEELNQSSFIMSPQENSCSIRVHHYFNSRQLALDITDEIDEDSVILAMVRHGLGVTIMPQLALDTNLDGLVVLPLPEPMLRPLAFACLPHRANLPIIRAFTEALVASAKAHQTQLLGVHQPFAPLQLAPTLLH